MHHDAEMAFYINFYSVFSVLQKKNDENATFTTSHGEQAVSFLLTQAI